MVKGTGSVEWNITTVDKVFCKSTNGSADKTTEGQKEIPYKEYMPILVKINICLSSYPLPVKNGAKH